MRRTVCLLLVWKKTSRRAYILSGRDLTLLTSADSTFISPWCYLLTYLLCKGVQKKAATVLNALKKQTNKCSVIGSCTISRTNRRTEQSESAGGQVHELVDIKIENWCLSHLHAFSAVHKSKVVHKFPFSMSRRKAVPLFFRTINKPKISKQTFVLLLQSYDKHHHHLLLPHLFFPFFTSV